MSIQPTSETFAHNILSSTTGVVDNSTPARHIKYEYGRCIATHNFRTASCLVSGRIRWDGHLTIFNGVKLLFMIDFGPSASTCKIRKCILMNTCNWYRNPNKGSKVTYIHFMNTLGDKANTKGRKCHSADIKAEKLPVSHCN